MAEAGAADRVTVIAADRELLQVLAANEAQRVLQHIGATLTPGGRLFIMGQMLDETHTTPLEAVGFNLIFLNTFEAGESYTEADLGVGRYVQASTAPL